MVTASNSGDSSAYALAPLPAGHRLTTELKSTVVPLTAPWHGPRRKHRFQQFIYCCERTRRGNVFVSRSLPIKGYTRYSIYVELV
jgi:hypothetical protein